MATKFWDIKKMEVDKIKKFYILLLLAFIFSMPLSASADRLYPGDEWPAENFQLGSTSDVNSEKQMDSIFYPFEALLNIATIPTVGVGSVTSSAFKKILLDMSKNYVDKYGKRFATGAVATAGVVTASEAGASSTFQWMNWPPRRFIFDSAEVKSMNILGGAAANGVISMLNSIANFIFIIPKACVTVINGRLLPAIY